MKALLQSCLIIVLSFLFAPVLAQTPVTFEYYQSLIFIKVKINGSRTNYLFLVNTGANTTIVDKHIAELIKLPVIKEEDSVTGTGGKEAVAVCKIKSLQAGDAVVRNMEVARRTLSNLMIVNGRKVDGVLGTDFLRAFSLSIDYNTRKLTFNGKKPVNRISIPFQLNDGIPKFTVKLDDTLHTSLHYNSGVSLESSRYTYVNISRRQFNALKRINPYIKHTSYINGRGVGGDINLQVLKISAMELNGYNIRNPYLILQPEEGYFKQEDAIGFFGNNLLEKYQSVTIDFPGERLYFNKLLPRKNTRISKRLIANK